MQPIAGFCSDALANRPRGRALLLIAGAPAVGVFLFLVPLASTFVLVAATAVALQLVHDVLWGAHNPLLGTFVSARRRILVSSLTIAAGQAGIFLLFAWGFGAVERHERLHGGERFGTPVYWLAAALMIACVSLPALWLRQTPTPARAAAVAFSWRSQLRAVLETSPLRRLALLNFAHGLEMGAGTGFTILFVTQSLHIEKARYGELAPLLPLVTIALSVGCGLLATARLSRLFLAGTALLMALAASIGYASHGLGSALVAQGIIASSNAIYWLVYRAHLVEYVAPAALGSVTSANNVFYGIGRMLAILLTGALIAQAGNDYRILWPCLLAAALLRFVIALNLKEKKAAV